MPWRPDGGGLGCLNAIIAGLEAGRQSPAMRLLITADEAQRTFRAADASELWPKYVVEGIGQRIALGEVRDDVPAEALAQWVVRLSRSLVAEPGRPEDGGDERILRMFLPASLEPAAHRKKPTY